MRVLVADKSGFLKGQLDCGVGPISTILNDIGKTTLTVSKSSTHSYQEQLLKVGNLVYIEFDNGLPSWGGVMDLPFHWDRGSVELSCYNILKILRSRITDKNVNFKGAVAGDILELMTLREQDQHHIGLTLGSIWKGGAPHYPSYHYEAIDDVINNSVREMERCDVVFTPYLDNSYIRFRVDMFEIAGIDKSDRVKITEGRNAGENFTFEEQGELINSHVAIGSGAGWDDERPALVIRDRESIAKYGLRETARIYNDDMISSLLMYGRNVIKQNSEPRIVFRVPVVNQLPGRFEDYDIGDIVAVSLPSYKFGGFYGNLRITAREFTPETGICEVVLEQINDPTYWIYQEDVRDEEWT